MNITQGTKGYMGKGGGVLMKVRNKCIEVNCERLGRNKGYDLTGVRVWDKYCEVHHRIRTANGKKHISWLMKGSQTIGNSKCQLCGWDKAPCDRHRISKEKGYTEENVLILCPNCHRLATLNRI